MRILFLLPQIGSPASGSHAIGTLSAVLKQDGHTTSVYEATSVEAGPFQAVLAREQPHLLAITSVTQQIPYVTPLLAHVARWDPRIITVLGGVHATMRPHVIHALPHLDALCQNEGELPLRILAQMVSDHGRVATPPPNMRIRTGGDIVSSPDTFQMTEEDLTVLPFEDREIFPRWKSIGHTDPCPLRPRFLFSRGCAFSCTGCSLPALRAAFPSRHFVRYPSVERCFAEIAAVHDRWAFNTFILDDDCPTQRKSWILEWAAKFPSRLRALRFEINARVETVDDEVMRALASTGCVMIKFGIESGDEDYRRTTYNRRGGNDEIREAFALARKNGMATKSYNIVGGPDETRRQIWNTVRLNQQVRPDRVQVSIYYPYPGTALGDRTIAREIIKQGVNNYFEHTCLKNSHISAWEVDLWAKVFRVLVYLPYNRRLALRELGGLFRKLAAKVRARHD